MSGLKILCFHSIDEIGSLVSLAPSLFRRHMEYLKKHGYKVVSLSEAVNRLRSGERLHGRVVVITFDDGFRNFYTHVFPLLKKFAFTATVFLVPESMNGTPGWIKRDFSDIFLDDGQQPLDEADLLSRSRALFKKRFPYFSTLPDEQLISVVRKLSRVAILPILSWEEVNEMSQYGIDFQAHSYTHPFLTELPEAKATDEIWRSKTEIETRIKRPVNFFCYPYGALNCTIKNILKDLGYVGACSTDNGVNDEKNLDPYALRRISIDSDCGHLKFRFYHSRIYDYYSRFKHCHNPFSSETHNRQAWPSL